MKIAFYQMRPFDEQAYIEQFSREFGIDVTNPRRTLPGKSGQGRRLRCRQPESLRNSARVRRGLGQDGRKVPALPQHRLRSISRWRPPKSWACG